jgi:hypothetical protein
MILTARFRVLGSWFWGLSGILRLALICTYETIQRKRLMVAIFINGVKDQDRRFPFWFPSSCLGTRLGAKLCFASNRPPFDDIPIAKLELGAQGRPQAGAWEREKKHGGAGLSARQAIRTGWEACATGRIVQDRRFFPEPKTQNPEPIH